MINNRLKAWVRYDGKNRIVPSSLILQPKKPKVGTWREVPVELCCNNINCNGQFLIPVTGEWFPTNVYLLPIEGLLNFPNHCLSVANLNPNEVGNGCVQLYINLANFAGDIQLFLTEILGRAGCLNLTQGDLSVTYSFTKDAWKINTGVIYFDTIYGGSPIGSLVVVTPSTGDFIEAPITISLSIIY